MRRRSLIASLFGIMAIAFVSLAATLIAGRSPVLGLDLRGGLSEVLQPKGPVSSAKLQQAVNIIDRRVNGLGVANSNVQRQGKDVVIDVPGIKNSNSALKYLGTPAQLFFRPVDCEIPPYAKASSTTTTTTPKSSTTTSPTTAPKSSTTAKSGAAADPATANLTADLLASGTTTTIPTTTTSTSSSTSTTVPSAAAHKDPGAALANQCNSASAAALRTTNGDPPNSSVVLQSSKSSGYGKVRWILGPADLKGEIVKTASAALDQQNSQYVVNVTLTGKGLAEFNRVAAERYAFHGSGPTAGSDPRSLEAIELDGSVESAPTIKNPTFNGPVQISGSFTSSQASNLALQLRYGSLPVSFKTGSVNTLSATLGRADLRAGLLAGLGGILVVMIYMILYYRALGLVVVLGLAVGASLLYSILTELSYTSKLALTLAGITGIIVSVGITVDSYVVYFERLKDEVRSGRTIRSSVERGFTRAFKTVLTADLVSFLAALILYLFTVGDVKGFAFTLGLSTLLDVFTAYFFIRPIVVLLGRRRTTSETRFLGIARGLGAAAPEGAR